MNYFLKVTSKGSLPLVYKSNNPINGSFIAIGKFINEKVICPLEYIDSKNSNISFEKLLTLDVLETVGGGFLFSQKLVNIIKENFPEEVQFFNSKIEYKGNLCGDYYATNIYNKIDCYDLDRSIYKIHPVDKSYKFSKIVLKTTPLEEYGMIYNIVRNRYDNKIIVSDDFKKIVRENKINSLSFSMKKW